MFARLVRKVQDFLLFILVWCWVLTKHWDQYQYYLNLTGQQFMLPNPVKPRCANDKFFWRKIFDHDPKFIIISDKLAVKKWIADAKINLKTASVLWKGTDALQIPKDILQNNVVLKANHGWEMNMFIRDGSYDLQKLVQKSNAFLASPHGYQTGQWGYFHIPRCLFIEELLGDQGKDLIELKYYTFGQNIERLIVIYDRFCEIAADVWMPDNRGRLHLTDEKSAISEKNPGLPLPPTGSQAEEIAREIGSFFDHMRVDLYTDGQEIWLSELTVYNLGGHMAGHGLDPKSPLNTSWDLKKSWFLSTRQPGWRGRYAAAFRRHLNNNPQL